MAPTTPTSSNVNVHKNDGTVISSMNISTMNTFTNVADEQPKQKLHRVASDEDERVHLMPFEQCVNHVSRPEYVSKIRDNINAGPARPQRFVLWGSSGAGKSQIAIEVAHQYIDSRSVYCMRADSIASFTADCEEMMERHTKSKTNDALKWAVKWWDTHRKKSLVIFDNADDLSLFRKTGKDGVCLADFLPKTCPCIITSRDQRAAGELASVEHSQEVTTLSALVAFELFEKSLPKNWLDNDNAAHKQEADRLLEDLDYLPLTIAQAATDIREAFMDSSIHEYRSFYKRHIKRALKHPLRREDGIRQSVLDTWDSSLELLGKQNSKSVEILNHLVFFDWERLTIGMARELAEPYFQSETEQEISEALSTLINLGFLSKCCHTTHGILHMHTSVQVWNLLRLKPECWPKYLESNIELMWHSLPCHGLPIIDYFLPTGHMTVLSGHCEKIGLQSPSLVRLLSISVVNLNENGDTALASELYERCCNIAEYQRDLGDLEIRLRRLAFNSVMQSTGRGEEALQNMRKLLETSFKEHGFAPKNDMQSTIISDLIRILDHKTSREELGELESCVHKVAALIPNKDSADLARANGLIALLHLRAKSFDEASKHSKRFLEWMDRHDAYHDPDWQGPLTIASNSLWAEGNGDIANLKKALILYWRRFKFCKIYHEQLSSPVINALSTIFHAAQKLGKTCFADCLMFYFLAGIDQSRPRYCNPLLSELMQEWGIGLSQRGRYDMTALALKVSIEYQELPIYPELRPSTFFGDGLVRDTEIQTELLTFSVWDLIIALEKQDKHDEASTYRERFPDLTAWIEQQKSVGIQVGRDLLKDLVAFREEILNQIGLDPSQKGPWWQENGCLIRSVLRYLLSRHDG